MIQALTKESHKVVKTVFSRYGTKSACRRATKLSNDALENLINKGRGRAENIAAVAAYIGHELNVDEYSIKATA